MQFSGYSIGKRLQFEHLNSIIMSNTEQEEFTQEQLQLKLAATSSIKKTLIDIEQVKHYATRAALNLSLEVVPEQIDIDFTAIRVCLESSTKAYKTAFAAYTEYAANFELTEKEGQPKSHRVLL